MKQPRHPVNVMRMCCRARCILGLERIPKHSTCSKQKNLSFQYKFRWELEWIETNTTPCQCHLRVLSGAVHLEARCDIPTFELAFCEKNFFVKIIWIQRWVRLEQLQHLFSSRCVCCPMQCIGDPDETPRHSNCLIIFDFDACEIEPEMGPIGQTATTALCHGTAL